MGRGGNPDARGFDLLWRGWWTSPVHQQRRWRAVITELSGDPVVPCLDLSFLVNYKNREPQSLLKIITANICLKFNWNYILEVKHELTLLDDS